MILKNNFVKETFLFNGSKMSLNLPYTINTWKFEILDFHLEWKFGILRDLLTTLSRPVTVFLSPCMLNAPHEMCYDLVVKTF